MKVYGIMFIDTIISVVYVRITDRNNPSTIKTIDQSCCLMRYNGPDLVLKLLMYCDSHILLLLLRHARLLYN